MKKLFLAVMTFVMLFCMTACSSGFLSDKQMLNVPEDKNPVANITLTYNLDDGAGERVVDLQFKLYYNKAPGTVANFVQLAQSKYYDGKIIHFAETTDGTGSLSHIIGGQYYLDDDKNVVDDGKNYKIKGEFAANNWDKNDLKHTLGALGMARELGDGANFDTASTAFYVVLNENVSRDRNFCVFGEIIQSRIKLGSNQNDYATSLSTQFIKDMNNVSTSSKAITASKDGKTTLSAVPVKDIVITAVTVETNGIDYSRAKIAKA